MAEPLISVVIPAHQAERYLGEAVASVLGQGHRRLEVIVVDDGSTDGTAAAAASCGPRVRCVRQPRAGAAAARNRGVALARGELLAFLDADDVWEPGKLAVQLAALGGPERPDIVFGHVRQFVSPGLPDAVRLRLRVPAGLQPGPQAGTMLLRRSTFARVGPFDASLRAGEMMDWLLRARELGLRELMLGDHVLSRRVHGANQMLRDRAAQRDYLVVLRAALGRRRALESTA